MNGQFHLLVLRGVPWTGGPRSVEWLGSVTPTGGQWEAVVNCLPVDSWDEDERIEVARKTWTTAEEARGWCHAQVQDIDAAQRLLVQRQQGATR